MPATMLKIFAKIISLLLFIVAGCAGIYYLSDRFSTQHTIEQLEERNKVLAAVVKRISAESRVAEVLVTDQSIVNGKAKSTLLFVEYDRDGNALPPKSFTIDGNEVHIDAEVIRFNQDLVGSNDPLRGHSLALFTKLYGNDQTPATGQSIDTPGEVPAAYRGSDPQVCRFESELWSNFWKLADDADYRKQRGVEVADGQGVWGPFVPDKLYTITLQAHGGVSCRSEPLKGIYREALKQKSQVTPAAG